MKQETATIEAPRREDVERRRPFNRHPSRNLEPRAKGYGIGGGYERPYRRPLRTEIKQQDSYGPVPHSGYYGAGAGAERFERGQAGFKNELSWYGAQYGESTSFRSKGKD